MRAWHGSHASGLSPKAHAARIRRTTPRSMGQFYRPTPERRALRDTGGAMQRLDFRSPLSAYDQQAEDLRAGQRSGDPEAIAILKRNHPRFLDEKIPWLQKNVTD